MWLASLLQTVETAGETASLFPVLVGQLHIYDGTTMTLGFMYDCSTNSATAIPFCVFHSHFYSVIVTVGPLIILCCFYISAFLLI